MRAQAVAAHYPAFGRIRALFERAAGWAAAHVRLLLVLFVASRLLVLAVRLAVLHHSQNTTWYTYVFDWDYARQSDRGAYPYLSFWMEYPPVFPWLAVGLYRLTAVAGAAHRLLFFGATGSTFILAETVIFVCVYRLGRLSGGPRHGARTALLYALLFVPTYLYSGWFDTVPTALFMVAAVWLVERRLMRSAVAAGLGVMTKLFPAVLALLALRYLLRRAALRYVVVLGATVAAIALPLLLAAPRYFTASLEAMARQRPWETVWALWDGYYGFATYPDIPARFNPATAAATYHSHYSSILAGALVVPLLWLVLWRAYTRAPRALSPYRAVTLLALTLALLMLVYKGYSPQYLIWLLPLLFVALPPATAATFAVLLQIDNLLEYPVFFHWFAGRWNGLLVLTVGGRALLLIALCVVCYRIITNRRADPLPSAAAPSPADVRSAG